MTSSAATVSASIVLSLVLMSPLAALATRPADQFQPLPGAAQGARAPTQLERANFLSARLANLPALRQRQQDGRAWDRALQSGRATRFGDQRVDPKFHDRQRGLRDQRTKPTLPAVDTRPRSQIVRDQRLNAERQLKQAKDSGNQVKAKSLQGEVKWLKSKETKHAKAEKARQKARDKQAKNNAKKPKKRRK